MNCLRAGAHGLLQGCSQDFHKGGAQLDGKVVIQSVVKLRMASFTGHRGWVREGDVPPPPEGGSFWHF